MFREKEEHHIFSLCFESQRHRSLSQISSLENKEEDSQKVKRGVPSQTSFWRGALEREKY